MRAKLCVGFILALISVPGYAIEIPSSADIAGARAVMQQSTKNLKLSPTVLEPFNIGEDTFDHIAGLTLIAEKLASRKESSSQLKEDVDSQRLTERNVASASTQLLELLHAPKSEIYQYAAATDLLYDPLHIDPRATKQYGAGTGNEYAASFLYECVSAFPDDKGALTNWVQQKYGNNGSWYYHLGQVDTCIYTIHLSDGQVPLLKIIPEMCRRMPPGVSKNVSDALNTVADTSPQQFELDTLHNILDKHYLYAE